MFVTDALSIEGGGGNEFLWAVAKFKDRLYLMRDMLERYCAGDADWDPPLAGDDPFQEPADTVVVIGTVRIFLQSLAYLVIFLSFFLFLQTMTT